MLPLLLLLACAPVGAPTLLLPPDAAYGAREPGARGPFGAAVVDARAQARVTDAIALDIVYPADAAGEPAVEGAPVVVFVHGGLVAPERYHWLAAHLATRGWVSVLPEADLHLAIAEPGNGELALDRLQALADGPGVLGGLLGDAPTVAMGHSLGGVMAASQWVRDDDVDALVLLASFPADFTPVETGEGPVLALTGTTDVFEWATLEAQLDRVRGPTLDARVEGMNHYAWTDDPSEGDLAGDGPQTRPVEATRTDALRVLDTWLSVHVEGADPGALDGPFPGVVLP